MTDASTPKVNRSKLAACITRMLASQGWCRLRRDLCRAPAVRLNRFAIGAMVEWQSALGWATFEKSPATLGQIHTGATGDMTKLGWTQHRQRRLFNDNVAGSANKGTNQGNEGLLHDDSN